MSRAEPSPPCIRRRHAVACASFLGLVIVYALRTVLSVAVVPMAAAEGWTSAQSNLALAAFFAGYIVLQIPGGAIAGLYGAKTIFGLGVLLPSIFTILVPPAAGVLGLLVGLRVLTGLGEAVTYPSLHALLGEWSPAAERSQMVGFVWSGAYFGTMLTFPVAGELATPAGWPSVFYLAGGAGVAWTLLWWLVVSSRPSQDRLITPAERKYIEDTAERSDYGAGKSWSVFLKLLSSSRVWAIVSGHVAHNTIFYLLLVELPTFLDKQLGLNLKTAGFASILPYLGCFLGSAISGRVADWLIESCGWHIATTRRVFQFGFEVAAGLLLVLAGYLSDPVAVVALITTSVTFVGAGSAGGYAPAILDASSSHAGVIMGISNTMATIPGIVAPLVVAAVVKAREGTEEAAAQWRDVFWAGAAVSLVGNAIFALLVRGEALKELDDSEKDAASSASTAPLVGDGEDSGEE